jgi:hypothetical protein
MSAPETGPPWRLFALRAIFFLPDLGVESSRGKNAAPCPVSCARRWPTDENRSCDFGSDESKHESGTIAKRYSGSAA